MTVEMAETNPLTCRSYGRSEVGHVRTTNEDSYYADDHLGLYIVCDGMGGHSGGEVASTSAIQSAVSYIETNCHLLPQGNLRIAQRLVRDAIIEANDEICYLARESACFRDMGTTITMMLICGDVAVLGHCGDSRAYRAGQRLELLTTDHTWEQELRAGGLCGDDLKRFGHMLTRVLGREDFAGPDLQTIRLRKGSRYLLCTDGLSRYLQEHQLTRPTAKSPEHLVDQFVHLAMDAGGTDNITAIVIDV